MEIDGYIRQMKDSTLTLGLIKAAIIICSVFAQPVCFQKISY